MTALRTDVDRPQTQLGKPEAAAGRSGARRVAGRLVLPGLGALLLLTITYSVTLGRYHVGFAEAWLILIDNVVPLDHSWAPVDESVVEQVRLPRILAAVSIGAGLSVAGAALQGMFRNPLVDPGIVGVISGAAFGGTLAILLVGGGYPVLAVAFGFGVAAMLLVRFLASVKGRTSILTLVLAGFIVTAAFEAAISIIKLMADPRQKLPSITYWLLGSLASTTYRDVLLIAVAVVPAAVVIYLLRFQLNVLSMGEDKARALGSPVALVQWLIFACTAFICAGVVATSGIIGWVGLVVPHAARVLVGANHTRVLPVSALLGAIYLVIVDNLARTLTEAEIPIGILTALIGVPVVALLLRRLQTASGWSND